jgi:5-methylcytosine-specific restriction enzyme A
VTLYFQHVGEANARRDFPRTIANREGLVCFSFDDIADDLRCLPEHERAELRSTLRDVAPSGFQIWGVPSGAKSMLRHLTVGDHFALLVSIRPYGQIEYIGEIVGAPTEPCHDLSMRLWGEQRFPVIVFMMGRVTAYPWDDFRDRLGYAHNWDPAGSTWRVKPERLRAAGETEETFVKSIF